LPLNSNETAAEFGYGQDCAIEQLPPATGQFISGSLGGFLMAATHALAVQPSPQIERFVNADTAAMFLGITRPQLAAKGQSRQDPRTSA